MANYQKILQEFNKLGLNESSRVSEVETKHALDQICRKNAGLK
jgi:hypothetical protein